MKYRRTKIVPLRSYTSLKSAPLDVKDLILRQVNAESEREYTSEEKPRIPQFQASHEVLQKNVGWLNFFKSTLLEFRP